MLRAILNKSWRQHSTKHQLYGHLPPITKTIKVRRFRHAGHCWRTRDELISDELLWTPSHGRAKAGRPARTYKQQLRVDTGRSIEDLPEAMDDRKGCEGEPGISVLMAWRWWWLLFDRNARNSIRKLLTINKNTWYITINYLYKVAWSCEYFLFINHL